MKKTFQWTHPISGLWYEWTAIIGEPEESKLSGNRNLLVYDRKKNIVDTLPLSNSMAHLLSGLLVAKHVNGFGEFTFEGIVYHQPPTKSTSGDEDKVQDLPYVASFLRKALDDQKKGGRPGVIFRPRRGDGYDWYLHSKLMQHMVLTELGTTEEESGNGAFSKEKRENPTDFEIEVNSKLTNIETLINQSRQEQLYFFEKLKTGSIDALHEAFMRLKERKYGLTLKALSRAQEEYKYDEKNLHKIFLVKGSVLFAIRKYNNAFRFFKKAWSLNPISFDSNMFLAYYFIGMNEPESALEIVGKALKINPKSEQANGLKISLLFDLSNYEEALNVCDFLLTDNPHNWNVYCTKSLILLAMGAPERSISILESITATNNVPSEIFWVLAFVSYFLGRFSSGIKYLKLIEEQKKDLGRNFWQLKGMLYAGIGEHSRSLKFYEKALLKGKGEEELLLLLELNDLGFLWRKNGDSYFPLEKYDEALKYYKMSLIFRLKTHWVRIKLKFSRKNMLAAIFETRKGFSLFSALTIGKLFEVFGSPGKAMDSFRKASTLKKWSELDDIALVISNLDQGKFKSFFEVYEKKLNKNLEREEQIQLLLSLRFQEAWDKPFIYDSIVESGLLRNKRLSFYR